MYKDITIGFLLPTPILEFSKTKKEVKVKGFRRGSKFIRPFRRKQIVGSKKETNTNRNLAIGATGVLILAGAVAANQKFRLTDRTILEAASLAYKDANAGLSKRLVDSALSSNLLSLKAKKDLANMSGAARVYLANTVFDKRGYKLLATSAKNNFSTWQIPDGSLMSVGSAGNNVLTFLSKKEEVLKGGFPQYQMSFRVNEAYNRQVGLSREEGMLLVRQTKSMYNEQFSLLPENALLRAEAWKGDNLGKKRGSIYEKKGFREIPGMEDPDHIYAVKNLGKFSRIEDDQIKHILVLKDKVKQ